MKKAIKQATFGGGCFWGLEKFFKKQFPKLLGTRVGYAGGGSSTTSYEEVCSGKTGHAEVVQVDYNPEEVKFKDLAVFFFRIHDPTTLNRQGNDRGTQYRSAIFYHDEEQHKIALEVRDEVQKTKYKDSKIVTEIQPYGVFVKAEDYHQDYLSKNPGGYCNHKLRW